MQHRGVKHPRCRPRRLVRGCASAEPLLAAQDAKIVQTPPLRPSQLEKWGTLEIELQGPRTGNPFKDVELTAYVRTRRRRTDCHRLLRRRRDLSHALHARQGRAWKYTTTSNVRRSTARRASSQSSRPRPTITARSRSATRSTSPMPTARRTSSSARRATPGFTKATTRRSKRSRRWPRRRSTSSACACFPSGTRGTRTSRCSIRSRARRPTSGTSRDSTRRSSSISRSGCKDLRDLGIEADIILFHPYDEGHWGFDRMPDDADDRYLRYVVSRLAAYRNVWWSLANEYDFMTEKQESDWDRFIRSRARRPIRTAV